MRRTSAATAGCARRTLQPGPGVEHAVPLDEELHEVGIDGADHETEQHLRLLRRCIEQLEPLNRALLLLYLEDRSHREIAEVLGISESNVATKLNRLKQRIRNDIA